MLPKQAENILHSVRNKLPPPTVFSGVKNSKIVSSIHKHNHCEIAVDRIQAEEKEGVASAQRRVLSLPAAVGTGLPRALDAAPVHPHHGPGPHLQAALSPSGLL